MPVRVIFVLCSWDVLANPDIEGFSYLVNFPFQPVSAQPTSVKAEIPTLVLDYTVCESHPSEPKPSVQPTSLDLSSLFQSGSVRHVFATSGPKARPVQFDVNGRSGRRAICVLYGDAMRYDVLDLDAGIEDEEEDEAGGVEG